MALEMETATYIGRLNELLPDEGKYVLIHGEEIAGVWETYEDALQAGYQTFALSPFLVKRIEGAETVQNFTRDFPACHS